MRLSESFRLALCESLGTFFLIFAGAGAIVIDGVAPGAIGHIGVAATFGLVVLAIIYTFGDISGAHVNPAVTIAFAVAGRMPWARARTYLLAQFLGAIAASALLAALFPSAESLGATIPKGAWVQTLILEVALTFFLMTVIFNVSTGAKEKGVMAGVAVGATVGLMALFAGPISGASMNPARSFGPAILELITGTGNRASLTNLWIYFVAPISGALLTIPLCELTRGADCCPAASGDKEKTEGL